MSSLRLKILSTLVVSLLSLCSSWAQESVLASKASSEALAAVYAYDDAAFAEALSRIDDKAIAAFVVEYKSLLDYTAANNDGNYKRYVEASDKALAAVAKHRFEPTLTSNLQMHRSLVELSTGSLWGGGVYFWKSYRSFKRGEESHKDYDGQLMLRGIFDVLLSQIPEKWKGLAGLFGFSSGNLQQGFAEIEQYHQKVASVPGLSEESQLLVFANIFLSHDQRINDEQRSRLRNNTTPVVVYAYILSNGRNCMGSEADAVMSRLPQSVIDRFPLIIHQQAKFALRRLDTKSAIRYADEFLQKYRGSSCCNDAPLLKAYAYLVQGDTRQALENAQKAADMPFSSDVDKRTNADAKIFPTMDRTLVKARFQFEYGNFAESLATLRGYNPPQQHLIEYNFRLARAEEKLGNLTSAISCYDKAIAMSAKDKRYFGPYSAVYAADLMLRQGNLAKAKEYIQKARSLNNGEFSKEIDQRISLTLRAIDGDK
ncbi:MAG: tetratricopeptide repeat protein [Bacteroidales bacterium]|nr:tetratricopeptide repeat protein [Bacteroidales bacterium]